MTIVEFETGGSDYERMNKNCNDTDMMVGSNVTMNHVSILLYDALIPID